MPAGTATPATPAAKARAPELGITSVRLSDQLYVLPAWRSPAASLSWGWYGRARRLSPGQARASSSRNAGIMAAGTTLSRLTGFARFLAVAWVLGQGHLADAYNQANTVPNTVYDLLLGGVLSATLLPVLMQSMTRAATSNARREDEEAVPAVVTSLSVFLLVATALFWVAAPLIIDFYLALASGPGAASERALATSWLRLFSPQLFFIGLITITTALLNARRRFMAVAFSPVLANIVTIAALVLADHMVRAHTVTAFRATPKAVLVIGLGTTAGYVVQLLAQVPSLLKAGLPLRLLWRPRHPALTRIVRLSGWTIGAVATNQASFALVSLLANRRPGNYSSFTYSYQFLLLPYSVIAVSIAAAMAPELAELWSKGARRAFGRRLSLAMRGTLALVLPAAAGYAVVARPVSVLATAHGALGVHQALSTGTLLAIFALGLPGFSCYLLMMRAFQAQQDARSMFWLYVVENGL
ncbi:MAG TPA: lipid II flippase MurJ, partial [Acidimicrobiales bacterium]|nr:lipid II flippase MurJ [Acidimicrobiales bacterium]